MEPEFWQYQLAMVVQCGGCPDCLVDEEAMVQPCTEVQRVEL